MTKLFISVLTYDRKIDAAFFMSLHNALNQLTRERIPYYIYMHCGNCYVADARSKCINEFMKGDCTHHLFIDSDLIFPQDAIKKLIDADKGIICGAYPYKDKQGFPIKFTFENDDTVAVIEDGLFVAEKIPTGFLLVKRAVFEAMYVLHPEWSSRDGLWRVFDTGMVIQDDNEWYSEDIAFSHRAIADGHKLYIDPDITFEHMHISSSIGNLKEYLGANKNGKSDI